MLAAGPVFAQGNAPAESTPEHPGRQVLASKCTQCHGDSMWRDIRQDETAWRATIYRMIGKGAVWSEAEVRAMSGYLASVMGPSASASATAPAAK
jgi:cytochrome c5